MTETISPCVPDGTAIKLQSSKESRSIALSISRLQSSIDSHNQLLENINRNKEVSGLHSKVERPNSVHDMDAMVRFLVQMAEKTNAHSNLMNLFQQAESISLEVEEQRRSSKDIGEISVDIEEINKSIDGVFEHEFKFIGCTVSGGRLIYEAIIGEHIIRPVSDCHHIHRVSGGHGDNWLKELKRCGAKRPPMHVIFSCILSNSGGCYDAAIRIPLSPFNLDQKDLFLNGAGEDKTERFRDAFKEHGHRSIDVMLDYCSSGSYKAHPHVRFGGVYCGLVCTSACTGNFSDPLCHQIDVGDFLGMATYIYSYMTTFDLQDVWGNSGCVIFSPRHIAECEEQAPIWVPMFTFDRANGVIEFMEKPEGFDYEYKVTFMTEEGASEEVDCDTEIVCVFDPEMYEACTHIKVKTAQGKSFMLGISNGGA